MAYDIDGREKKELLLNDIPLAQMYECKHWKRSTKQWVKDINKVQRKFFVGCFLCSIFFAVVRRRRHGRLCVLAIRLALAVLTYQMVKWRDNVYIVIVNRLGLGDRTVPLALTHRPRSAPINFWCWFISLFPNAICVPIFISPGFYWPQEKSILWIMHTCAYTSHSSH